MNTNSKKYYSPQFSQVAAITIRRLAWALGVTMTQSIDEIVGVLPSLFSPSVVCPQCKDNTKCILCGFNEIADAENAELSE